MSAAPRVEGEIRFEGDVPSFGGARLYVRVEDVTLADAAARVIAESVEHDVALDPRTRTSLPFSVVCPWVDVGAQYCLRVHIDLDGDGELSPGDFITTRSYPVLTFGNPTRVSVVVQRIG